MTTLRAAIIPVTPFQQNCTIVFDEETKHGVVIDPGGDLDQIGAAIEELGLTIDTILLTHGHIDHAAGADQLREGLGVEIVGPHEADKPLLDNLETQGAAYGIAGARNVTPDRWLNEGDSVEIAGHAFEVMHCPGHSPGSVVFVNKPAKFAIVGDVLFRGSIGRTDLFGGDFDTLAKSIREKLFPLGDDVSFLCGHGPGGSIGEERRTNPFVGENAQGIA
ncbi:MBL fold metallo-hydrolase [Microbaculum marinisediminis]|uniref:MBL fold metallo-hydrolase n=1 Tax=Microbaculum marinisediminis TaxID=2931392 RepID=A0AAW5R856_9HYPH|nr:MBL fold metallo-hydrolase [Microbaculum sp. A6E488]MCT8974839.1 MBL fold metallo-hydrolase [Microbaculum sp. A6E488]